ncbi:MAG: hypothetical protein SGBAC_004172 [Bacillariaceae sp.]
MTDAPLLVQDYLGREAVNMNFAELMNITTPIVHYYDRENYKFMPSQETALPIWQNYPSVIEPATQRTYINYDMMSLKQFSELFYLTNATLKPTVGFSEVVLEGDQYRRKVSSQIMQPIFKTTDPRREDKEMVGVIWLTMKWTAYFEDFFAEESDAITLVLRNSCPRLNTINQPNVSHEVNAVSFEINGPEATFLGEYDAHDPQYDSLEVTSILVDIDVDPSHIPSGQCIPKLSLHLYPTEAFEETFYTPKRFLYTGIVRKVMDRIMMQDQIVANVFPTTIRNRLYDGVGKSKHDDGNFVDQLDIDDEPDNVTRVPPMADLFPNTTIVFADIVGFTAWSSAREPQQVFTLLETIYAVFDRVAYRHGVFKVETVGDSYVAATGLPEPMKEHAVVACKFARDCLKKMSEITPKLEVSLGPDTSDLRLRVGIHSGQVTAGILRGERSRFQLFGDTMNTASRMESTGRSSCIQLSQTTADLLKEGGFANMIIPRAQKTFVKGKGDMQTYWLRSKKPQRIRSEDCNLGIESTINEETTAETSLSSSDDHDNEGDLLLDMNGVETMNKSQRLVEWNVEVLHSLLEQLVTSRGGARKSIKPLQITESKIASGQTTVLEEFVPIIQLKRPDCDLLERGRQRSPSSGAIVGDEVKSELRRFLTKIAEMYTDSNPFHNFEHASHVTASVKKLLKRIVNVGTGNGLTQQQSGSSEFNVVDLAGHSYGITSDPLVQFSVVFAAIIHDLDHPGVPNAQLVKEGLGERYKNKSVAEQNSVDIAWKILMQHGEHESLRSCIYQTKEELLRFRQLVVNTVMATDICDKELQALRKNRWEAAFSASHMDNIPNSNTSNITNSINGNTGGNESYSQESEDRKATIVIEHLIQASDIAHTMQHWHIYKSWNEKFFMECYSAYKAGRANDVDPSINWYQGEIGFFDFYVIPLAKKLDSCGVFGVSSHEYLNYAMANRAEWEREGEQLVQEFVENCNGSDGKE